MPILSLIATLLMFVGGVALTYDALRAPSRRKAEKGAAFLADGERDIDKILRYVHRRQNARAWWGFFLTTLGFLLQLIAQGIEVASGS